MKTKITISVIIGVLFAFGKITAQTYYYNESKTFPEDGYAYQCDVHPSNFVTLYNANDVYTYQDIYYQDGSLYRYNGLNSPLEDNNWTDSKCISIVNNAFSSTEKNRVEGKILSIVLIISPQTGRVIEVYFKFLKNNAFATIPVSVYREIELNLKRDVWFTPTEEGKKLKYIMNAWVQHVE